MKGRVRVGWNIKYYQLTSGNIPVLDLLNSLEVKLRAKSILVIELLEKYDLDLKEPYAKSIKGKKYQGGWELRLNNLLIL